MLAQNAMRPCFGPAPVGVDARAVGTWVLPVNGGRWIWEIHRAGTYRFRMEAANGTSSPWGEGTIAFQNGRWKLDGPGAWDLGTYSFNGADVLAAQGKLGLGYWRRLTSGSK